MLYQLCKLCILLILCGLCNLASFCPYIPPTRIIIWLILKTFLWRSRKRKNVFEKTHSATKKPKALRNLEDDEEVEEDFASGEVRRNSRGLPLTPTGRPSIKLNEVNRKFTPKYHNREKRRKKHCSASKCRWAAQWLCWLQSDMDLSCLLMTMATMHGQNSFVMLQLTL